jgi:Flp pilus assembly protein TadD
MLFKQSDNAVQAGNWSAAMTYLDQARRIEPRNPYVLYRQAWASAQSGDTERARQLLERARVFVNKDDDLLNYRLYELEFQLNP